MEPRRLRECLDADYGRLREVLDRAVLDAPIPSCPQWSVADLTRHLAKVYLHKVACTELGKAPDNWPPDLSAESPTSALDRAYGDLSRMFDTYKPSDPSFTWYDDDQTVGFWIRRMAQETVIHRRDAELAVGHTTPAPDDLAVDGIAELLEIFVSWATKKWSEESREILEPLNGDTFLVEADGTRWFAEVGLSGVELTYPRQIEAAAVRITGDPSSVLFWLWNRAAPSDKTVTVEGEQHAVARIRSLLTAATQ